MITVAIPAYGHQELLDITLRVLRWQKGSFDTLVVDDGSPTPLVVPDWVRLIRTERGPYSQDGHRSASYARNVCFRESATDYVLAMDSTILLAPGTIEALLRNVEFLEEHPYDDGKPEPDQFLITLHTAFIEERMDPQDMTDMEILYRTHMLSKGFDQACADHTVVFMKRELWLRNGGYDTVHFKSWGLEGQDFTMRALRDWNVAHLSTQPRKPGELLYAIHNPHDAPRDTMTRDAEFAAKWGEPYDGHLSGARKLSP